MSQPTAPRPTAPTKGAFLLLAAPLLVLIGFGVRFGLASRGLTPTAFPWHQAAEWAFSALLIALMFKPLFSGAAWRPWRVFKQFHPLVLVQCVLLIAVTIGTAFLLYSTFPFLRWSWLHWIPGEEKTAINIGLLPTRLPIIGPIFCVLFALNIPLFAEGEERQYRHGTRNWKHALVRSLRFGLAHCWVGVPIYVGLALSIGGLWYSKQYFDGGVERSTLHHATYNLIIISLVLASLISGRF